MLTENDSPVVHNDLLVIKASAGSGKTYTLTKRYIELLLFRQENGCLVARRQRNYHRHILAITFTNKATDEMKSRIVQKLYAMSRGDEEYLDYFKKECAPQAFAQIRQLAQTALHDILFDYSNFNVSTIDSFFQTVLRTFARELDRDYHYDVQIDTDHVMRVAVHNFLLSLGNDIKRNNGRATAVDEWVREFIGGRLNQGKSINFFKDGGDLTEFAGIINKELFRKEMAKIRDYLLSGGQPDLKKIQSFQQFIAKLLECYQDIYRQLPADFQDIARRAGFGPADVAGGTKGNALRFLFSDFSALNPTVAITNFTREKAEKSFTAGYRPSDAAIDEIMALHHRLLNAWSRLQFYQSVIDKLGLLGLIGMIDIKLEEYRRDNNSILLADTNELIDRVLKSGVPFVYERVGTRISHFMIDEFQDTSAMQYGNFKPLIKDALTQNEDDNMSMLIGDGKQSIYRFRNADPDIFRAQVESDFTQTHTRTLNENHRTLQNIVGFNNELFAHTTLCYQDNGIIADTYADVKQQVPDSILKKPDKGYVHIRFADDKGDPFDSNGLSQVTEMLPQYLLELHKRFRWKEIGILVNTKGQGAQVVQSLLEHNSGAAPQDTISVMSDEALQLKNSPTVRRVIAVLRFIDVAQCGLDEDTVSLLESEPDKLSDKERMRRSVLLDQIEKERVHNITQRFLHATQQPGGTKSPGEILSDCIEQEKQHDTLSPQEQLKRYEEEAREWLPNAHNELMTLTSIVEHIVDKLIAEAPHISQQESAYLFSLQDRVMDFVQRSGGGTVREFLRYWDEANDSDAFSVKTSAGHDALTVITIHKAKGLEFPCVLIPFADWDIEKTNINDRTYWIPYGAMVDRITRDLADEKDFPPGTVPPLNPLIVPPLLCASRSAASTLAESGPDGEFRQFVNKQVTDSLIDNLNKTYVAFTRPKEELHIFTYHKAGKSAATKRYMQVGDLLHDFIAAQPDECLQRNDATILSYTLGEPSGRRGFPPEKDTAGTQETLPYQVASALGNIQISIDEESGEQQNLSGNLLALLRRIHYADQTESALAYAEHRGMLAPDHNAIGGKAWLRTHVLDPIAAHPVVHKWFDRRCKVFINRAVVKTAHGSKRVHRIVQHPDGSLTVVHYNPDRKRNSDLCQLVSDTMATLQAVNGAAVNGYVWHLVLGQTEQVSLQSKAENKNSASNEKTQPA